MVIEHKSLVWPRDYLESHRREHVLFDAFSGALLSAYSDSWYQLQIEVEDIHVMKTSQIKSVAAMIEIEILARNEEVLQKGLISSRSPIRWSFRRVPDVEVDPDESRRGVRITISDPPCLFGQEWHEARRNAREGLSIELHRCLQAASRKLVSFRGCLRILILKPYGDSYLVNGADVEALVGEAYVPQNIDEIWLAEPDWEGEVQVIQYRLLKRLESSD